MKALLLKAVEALKQGLRIEELGRREDVHWESLRDMRRAFHDQQLAAIADLEAAIREQPGEAECQFCGHPAPGCALKDATTCINFGHYPEKVRAVAVAPLKDEGEARALTNDEIADLWIYRKNIHGGILMPQLIDFARAVLSGKAQP